MNESIPCHGCIETETLDQECDGATDEYMLWTCADCAARAYGWGDNELPTPHDKDRDYSVDE